VNVSRKKDKKCKREKGSLCLFAFDRSSSAFWLLMPDFGIEQEGEDESEARNLIIRPAGRRFSCVLVIDFILFSFHVDLLFLRNTKTICFGLKQRKAMLCVKNSVWVCVRKWSS
jgi:hypothetical protein